MTYDGEEGKKEIERTQDKGETIRKERNTQRKAEKEIETKRDRKIRKRKGRLRKGKKKQNRNKHRERKDDQKREAEDGA